YVDEITTLMSAMYRTFNAEHGLTLGSPMMFSVRRYQEELDRIEGLHRKQFGALTLVTTEKWALMRRFFESVAARIKEVYDLANREVEAWLRAVIAPIEGQVREHQAQLRRRLDSVKRVLDATESLDARIAEIDESRAQVEQQLAIAGELADQVRTVLAQDLPALHELEAA
ncbi:MAG TPA: GTPase, partial [Quisquiliibacterium sp.]|nr:GTPase [Quisquiliibacterium sp.]